MGRLIAYAWPGNIRELENVIERLVVLSDGPHLSESDLPSEILGLRAAEAIPLASEQDEDLKQVLKNQAQALEKEMVLRALEKNRMERYTGSPTSEYQPKNLADQNATLRIA